MENVFNLSLSRSTIKTALFDISALMFIYITPTISHLLNFPLYLLEPMRLMMILVLIHTGKKNVLFIAFTLPVFSYLISSHPSLIKSLLIGGELVLNVYLFWGLEKIIKNSFFTAFLSIIISKLVYYAFKAIFLSTSLMQGELISTSLYIQLIMTCLFSTYVFIFMSKKTDQ